MNDVLSTARNLGKALSISSVLQSLVPYVYVDDDNRIVIGHDDDFSDKYVGEVSLIDAMSDADVCSYELRWEDEDAPITLTHDDADVVVGEITAYLKTVEG